MNPLFNLLIIKLRNNKLCNAAHTRIKLHFIATLAENATKETDLYTDKKY